jgi:tRNA-dihydrouridine synthase B
MSDLMNMVRLAGGRMKLTQELLYSRGSLQKSTGGANLLAPMHHEIYPESAVILAPLSNYTDAPFRRACRRCGCRYAFTQLVDAGSLVFGRKTGAPSMHRFGEEPWLGVQLLGASPDVLARAATILNDRNYDLLDFNMGCPMPKITKKGAGAALGKNVAAALRCLEALVAASRFPVTAKIRVLSTKDPAATVEYALALERTGLGALTVHGRILSQVYSGPVAAGVIRAVREALRIPVIANGGVVDLATAQALREETGCGRIMVARGAIGNPWIFRELAGPDRTGPPAHDEVCDILREHVLGMIELYGDKMGVIRSRKIIHAYLAGRGYRRSRRREASALETPAQFEAFIKEIRAEGVSPRYVGTIHARRLITAC